MQLGEALGDVAQERWRQRSEAVIGRQPIFHFGAGVAADGTAVTGKGETAEHCCVCRCEYERDDECRLLNACGHAFHRECVDQWLQDHNTCPMCKVCIEEGEEARSV